MIFQQFLRLSLLIERMHESIFEPRDVTAARYDRLRVDNIYFKLIFTYSITISEYLFKGAMILLETISFYINLIASLG